MIVTWTVQDGVRHVTVNAGPLLAAQLGAEAVLAGARVDSYLDERGATWHLHVERCGWDCAWRAEWAIHNNRWRLKTARLYGRHIDRRSSTGQLLDMLKRGHR